MVVTLQAHLKNRNTQTILLAALLSAAVVLALFACTPRWRVTPFALEAEAAMEVVDIPDEIALPPVQREVPMPTRVPVITVVNGADEETEIPDDWTRMPPPLPRVDTEPDEGYQGVPVSLPVPIRAPQPRYPDLAREAANAGRVRVLMFVSERGDVVDARVVSADVPALLVDAALETARRWRFRPAMQGRRPVATQVTVSFEFTIH